MSPQMNFLTKSLPNLAAMVRSAAALFNIARQSAYMLQFGFVFRSPDDGKQLYCRSAYGSAPAYGSEVRFILICPPRTCPWLAGALLGTVPGYYPPRLAALHPNKPTAGLPGAPALVRHE